MKVVCIDITRGNARHLDLGKVYDATKPPTIEVKEFYIVRSKVYSNPMHRIGILPERDVWVGRECFVSLEEYRSKKLEQIGI